MKKLFVMFAVSALFVACGTEKTAEHGQSDSTKACCKDSTKCDSTKMVSDTLKVDTSVVKH
jgi:hypothetical protein